MGEIAKPSPSYVRYLQNGGEMGALIRSFDWSKTSLGHPDIWSQNLLTTLGIILQSRVPMFLFWGPESIQFYNDAYRPSLGNQAKHPKALGQSGKDCWPEIWAVIRPYIDQVMGGGEAIWQEDLLLPIYRNGRMEDVYWTFSYSQVIDVDGEIGGVLVTCFESTGKVEAHRSLNQTLGRLAESEAKMNHLITQAPVAIAVLKSRELLIDTANNRLLQFLGKTEAIIGKPLAIALPELEEQSFLQILDEVFISGKSYASSEVFALLENNGVLTEYYFDLIYQPIQYEQGRTDSILVVATDITEQVKARHTIEQSSLQFRQLADSITQMVWVTDEKGMHEYYNQRWYDFTGSDLETTKGEGWNQMFHPDDRERAWGLWNHSLKTGEAYEIEYRLKNYKGEYVWVLGRAAPFYDTEGRITKWFGTCTDIHDQKLLLEQKDDFISIASHELKTPLTSLKAVMQLINRMKDKSLTPLLSNLIDRASNSTDKIYKLVEDLLDASKLNHGVLALNKTLFILSDLIADCVNHLIIDDNYSIETIGAIDLEVCADAERIHQVITNFVSNAVKYAPDSKEIVINIERIDAGAKISVIDKGPGIAQYKTAQLFDRYYRVDPTISQKSGLGLGLYICSEIIKKHGGKIGVESEVGKGSIFWFTLPY
ncbi:ATP-binding protein [Pedobacter sp. JCM 36344]|uniref:ATP-binding protein n=1 Tax=Pedobacter sp. JCM 36344 TaxID=3374280 RepID=UPI003979655C